MKEQIKLPAGLQTLRSIISGGFCYVDKTALIYELIKDSGYYFFSRPRRFGKSLTIDTIKEIFEADRALFTGLAIDSLWDWSKTHPVIRINFSDGAYSTPEHTERSLKNILRGEQRRLGIETAGLNDPGELPGECLRQLVIQAGTVSDSGRVVLLVDEYDKPMVDYISQPDIFTRNRNAMRDFYSVIKGLDSHLRFCLLTGVSRFSRLNLFSGLNNLDDITLDDNYATLCGYTEDELTHYFGDYLQRAGADRGRVRHWYNGYRFGAENPEKVYNPYGFLLFLKKGCRFAAYWAQTATPTLLVHSARRNHYLAVDFDDIVIDDTELATFDPEQMSFEALLFQTGYLTIDRSERDDRDALLWRLAVPNLEVRLALDRVLLKALTGLNLSGSCSVGAYATQCRRALANADFDGLQEQIKSLFSAIPWQDHGASLKLSSPAAPVSAGQGGDDAFGGGDAGGYEKYESYYRQTLLIFFRCAGLEVTAEDTSSRGQADLKVSAANNICIIEVRRDTRQSFVPLRPNPALGQILEKDYAGKYRADGRHIYAIGMIFSTSTRNLAQMDWQKIE